MSRPALLIGGLILGLVSGMILSGFRTAPEPTRQETQASSDSALVRGLLKENLDQRRFSFATVIEATSDRRVLPLDPEDPVHQRILTAIEKVMARACSELSAPDSPVRKLRRINEGSRFFEEALMKGLNDIPGLSCAIPTNRQGEHQRSGYPDLKLTDEESGTVFYLDPKLVEKSSWKSSFRSFYFEPKDRTLKINDDAVHLLIGIGHDGRNGAWTFSDWKVVDLATLSVRLKAEFQASNRDLYNTDAE
ncbi:MAG: hypothetical protein AAGB14_05430 [Verrucomicrobiota bacterium]